MLTLVRVRTTRRPFATVHAYAGELTLCGKPLLELDVLDAYDAPEADRLPLVEGCRACQRNLEHRPATRGERAARTGGLTPSLGRMKIGTMGSFAEIRR